VRSSQLFTEMIVSESVWVDCDLEGIVLKSVRRKEGLSKSFGEAERDSGKKKTTYCWETRAPDRKVFDHLKPFPEERTTKGGPFPVRSGAVGKKESPLQGRTEHLP